MLFSCYHINIKFFCLSQQQNLFFAFFNHRTITCTMFFVGRETITCPKKTLHILRNDFISFFLPITKVVISSPLVDKSAKAVHKIKFVSSPVAGWTGGSVGVTVGDSVIGDSFIGGLVIMCSWCESVQVHGLPQQHRFD